MKKGHYVKKLVPKTTNNITTGIINFLNEKGHVAVRINVQGQWDEALQRWRPSGSTKGVLDIQCTLAPMGKTLVVDTKNGKDRARPDQVAYAKDVVQAGGFAFFAESVEAFIQFYDTAIEPYIVGWKRAMQPPSENCEHKNTDTFRLETYCRDCGETL